MRARGILLFVLQRNKEVRHFFLLVVALLFLPPTASAQSQKFTQTCAAPDTETMALINQYRDLRIRRSQLPAGQFDKDLDDYRGELHKVLFELGNRLGHAPCTRENIVKLLGEPDALRNEKQMHGFLNSKRTVKSDDKREYLIYFWRGWHDFVFFISEGGNIVGHDWWFAYE